MSLNKVIIQGNISNEIECRQTANGTSVCSFNVALNRNFGKLDEKKVDFFTVVAWQQKAEFVSRYFKKGQAILVCGRLENREWSDKNGNKRISTEIIAEEISFAGNKENATEAKNEAPAQAYMPAGYATQTQAQFEEISSGEDLPF